MSVPVVWMSVCVRPGAEGPGGAGGAPTPACPAQRSGVARCLRSRVAALPLARLVTRLLRRFLVLILLWRRVLGRGRTGGNRKSRTSEPGGRRGGRLPLCPPPRQAGCVWLWGRVWGHRTITSCVALGGLLSFSGVFISDSGVTPVHTSGAEVMTRGAPAPMRLSLSGPASQPVRGEWGLGPASVAGCQAGPGTGQRRPGVAVIAVTRPRGLRRGSRPPLEAVRVCVRESKRTGVCPDECQ